MKSMQVFAIVLVAAASLVAGKPQYHPGYPYPGAPGYPYAPGVPHGLPAPVQDTPEVAAAKAAHFAAYNAAASGAPAAVPAVPGVYPGAPGYPYGAPGYPYAPVAPHGLPAPVQDTPEVAAAKAAHAAAHAAAGAHHYG